MGSGPGEHGDVEVTGDEAFMALALDLAAGVRRRTPPNPWVGAVVVVPGAGGPSAGGPSAGGPGAGGPRVVGRGATESPGGRHAEVVALDEAGCSARGAWLYVTLEPCCHVGRTGPCVEAIVAAGISRVVVGIEDPDPAVSGKGFAALEQAGVEVRRGVLGDEVAAQLAAYVVHRRTGRPRVVLKLAATLDGRIAAPDGSSRWITGEEARADAHQLRADADAVLVGAGTVRADDPALTVRLAGAAGTDAVGGPAGGERQPLRVVLGTVPEGAAVRPALELRGDLGAVLDELGRRGVLELLVEGGATVAHDFHAAGLVDRYVVYLAPGLFGGDDARPAFAGPGVATIEAMWRGRFVAVERLGEDLKLVVEAPPVGPPAQGGGAPPVASRASDEEAQ